MKTLKVNDKVIYRGRWGHDKPKQTTIESIELCKAEGEKYGTPIDSMTSRNYRKCVLSLADNHWCYGYQVDFADSVKLNN